MKKFITNVGYLAALVGVLYYVFLVPELTNKQLAFLIFEVMVIIILSIQKDQNENI